MDIDKVEEHLEIQASAAAIALDESHLTDDIITFNWTPARTVSDDHVVLYSTKLDLLGNNFGTSTAILSYEDDGVFSKSFTSEQLQNWANEKWGLSANKPFTLQFRVVAEWQGGPTFEAPEVRTVTVNVQPIKTVIFDADKVFLGGSAVPGMSQVEMSQTLENLDQYAYLLDLQVGELQIPVDFNGETNYICPTDGDGTLKDGEAVPVTMRDAPASWKIEEPGQYRVVVNMKNKTASIYSPEKALEPKTVVWNNSAGGQTTTAVTELWMHGAINNWGTPIKCNATVSLADPQILVYTGGLTGKTKFIVYGGNDNDKNLAYAFSCPLTSTGAQQEQTLVLGKEADLSGGFTSAQRNSYYTIPAGANIVILDLRNMKITAEKR
ncbi:hypothetical protein GCM10023231_34890 [Olivibacter ginsenosidimutans]|uniref:SusE outer membrane protein domain-containing protein n=2 Tax=Olivibacter ginsenosidimutans TaxID=1176537 RepID=A0ABP9C4N1_9SPHI